MSSKHAGGVLCKQPLLQVGELTKGKQGRFQAPHLAAEWFAILELGLKLLQGQIIAIAIRRLSESEIPVGER